jgi:hypothetical protein
MFCCILVFLFAHFVSASNLYWTYTIQGGSGGYPSDGVGNVTFPMKLHHWGDEKDWYIAQQFRMGGCSVGYTGIQPFGEGMQVIFSSFQKDTQVLNKEHCSDGADGGAGVSCSIRLPKNSVGSWYYLNVKEDNHVWTGVITDSKTGESTQIGKWQVPEKCKKVTSSESGFLEEFGSSNTKVSCDKKPLLEFDVMAPLAYDAKGTLLPSTIGKAYDKGKCQGKMGFNSTDDKTSEVRNVLKIKNGFVKEH